MERRAVVVRKLETRMVVRDGGVCVARLVLVKAGVGVQAQTRGFSYRLRIAVEDSGFRWFGCAVDVAKYGQCVLRALRDDGMVVVAAC